MRSFKFFWGYAEKSLVDIDWDTINRLNQITTIPVWTGTTYTPTWITNPGYIQYTPNYITTTNPIYTVTNTPGTDTFIIPYYGTTNTATGYSLTTSNPNGTTYTTANTFFSTTGTVTIK